MSVNTFCVFQKLRARTHVHHLQVAPTRIRTLDEEALDETLGETLGAALDEALDDVLDEALGAALDATNVVVVRDARYLFFVAFFNIPGY